MEILPLEELLGGSSQEDTRFFPSVLREKVLQLFDHKDYEAASSLILSLVKTERFAPNAIIYARLLSEIEQAKEPEVALSAYCTLKQLQCSCNVEMQAIVWRPKTERHWVYLCNLFSQLQKLESGENLNSESQEEDAYMYEEDRKRKRRQERQQQEGPPRKLRRKSAKDKETEFFQELEKKEEKKEEEKRSEHERLKIRLANTQYVLKYLLGIFQENLKNNPPLGERHILWSLIGCETKGDTDYGGEKGERLRKLFHLLFEVFAVGKRISCSLVMCLFEQVWKSVDGPTFNESLPGIFSEFKSLEEAKKREFLESLYNNEFRLQLVTYILTDIGSKKEVKDAKKWEQSPLTVEKISQYYLHLLPQAEGKKGGNAATREKAEESHCLLVSFLIQSYVVQYRDHLIKNPHEFTALQNEVEKWVGRRKRKATKALSSYLHRSQACFHFIKIE